MSDVETAAGGEDTTPAVTAITLDDNAPASFDSAESAVASLVGAREKAGIPAESADDATAEEELSDEDNAAPEKAHGEDQEADPAVEPLIERPKSWTEAEDAEWRATPRALQQKIVARELERDTALRRTQNEIAEERNATKAEREEAEKAKQEYRSKVPSLDDVQRWVDNGPFQDIKSDEDATNLLKNDPFRYLEWKDYQDRLGRVVVHAREIEGIKAQERQAKRVSYEAEQNKLLVELVPEMADPSKANVMRERAIAMLNNDLGLKTESLQRWMQDDVGHEILSNAGIQKLMADGLKYRDILSAPKAVVKPDLPPVQRPGVARAPGADKAALVQNLTDRLSNSGSENDAFELLMAKRASRRAS